VTPASANTNPIISVDSPFKYVAKTRKFLMPICNERDGFSGFMRSQRRALPEIGSSGLLR
jgi:hypothetical protein